MIEEEFDTEEDGEGTEYGFTYVFFPLSDS